MQLTAKAIRDNVETLPLRTYRIPLLYSHIAKLRRMIARRSSAGADQDASALLMCQSKS